MPSDTAGLWFGATHLQNYNNVNTNSVMAGKVWLNDSNSTTTTASGYGYSMADSRQGMFSYGSSINAFWADTTLMDNLRGADITDSTVAGSTEGRIKANIAAKNVRGGHSVHMYSGEEYYKKDMVLKPFDETGVDTTDKIKTAGYLPDTSGK